MWRAVSRLVERDRHPSFMFHHDMAASNSEDSTILVANIRLRPHQSQGLFPVASAEISLPSKSATKWNVQAALKLQISTEPTTIATVKALKANQELSMGVLGGYQTRIILGDSDEWVWQFSSSPTSVQSADWNQVPHSKGKWQHGRLRSRRAVSRFRACNFQGDNCLN
jgi:hypothetical protein